MMIIIKPNLAKKRDRNTRPIDVFGVWNTPKAIQGQLHVVLPVL